MKLTLALLLFATPLLSHGQSLKQVGDIGKVIDSQGVTSLRPTAGNRWTCATPSLPIKPGDWLRTDVRGANALHVKLAGGSELILGPGTLLEVVDPTKITLLRGEVEVAPGADRKLVVSPGEGNAFTAREATVLRRLDGEREMQRLENEPNWLKGFKGTVVRESMGQLVAKVDGRDTPLTIGYHKVTVDIRDQIARTTIEESFVNHTSSRLEGVFYFPLPQDASISGFGMWIDGELVEADVVEKQRAREIYETILRERRDPGLLEWTGGNLFKARVFPIFGGSEKRIKITYTQVLPYRNGSYRYSYALQSEMLRLNPLRELAVNVRVHSALPITKFRCPTHTARINTTQNSAQAEFNAQEYTPDRDFEIEIEVDNKASPVTVIPHRRGEDGYFLAMITPPDEAAAWQRDLVADGEPLELIVLADTSGSMDDTARANQDALLASLLGSLGEGDSFHLATCDAVVRWFQVEKFAGTQEEYIDLARGFVSARPSLGWSDLDAAFSSVMDSLGAKPNTHVIYIGDGVITTGNADPVAFANRLQRLYAERVAELAKVPKGRRKNDGSLATSATPTFHAIAPSSSFESGVLNSIAALGGGSVRKIEGSDTPAAVATQLLAEISAPGLRDMTIEFDGLRTARVYPDRLPNLASGKQQIILGRYLPQGEDQTGEIVVTGKRGGKTLTFRAPVQLRDAESGNSFIPRLWARMHLDALLAQGRTPEVRDEVIGLSEEYHIMTPYTSFLVLESDADRERFKVKRRFLMRDGERFFAEGRDAANYELLQKQMRLAGTWRLNLRRAYIDELRRIGRGVGYRRPANPYMDFGGEGFGGGGSRYRGKAEYLSKNRELSMQLARSDNEWTWDYSDGYADGKDLMPSDTATGVPGFDDDGEWDELAEMEGEPSAEMPMEAADKLMALEETLEPIGNFKRASRRQEMLASYDRSWGGAPAPSMPMGAPRPAVDPASRDLRYMVGFEKELKEVRKLHAQQSGGFAARHGGWHWRHHMQDLHTLFPAFSGSTSLPGKRADHPWPKEAVKLADDLLRLDGLTALGKGGVEIKAENRGRDPRLDKLVFYARHNSLLGGEAWATTSESHRADLTTNWFEKDTRGVMASGLGLGRTRPPMQDEGKRYPEIFEDASFTSLADRYHGHLVKIRPRGDDRILLVITPKDQPENNNFEQRFLIDTKRKVLLSHEDHRNGTLSSRREFAEHVKAGGLWWPTVVRHSNAEGKLTSETKLAIRALDTKDFEAAFSGAVAGRDGTLFLNEPQPTVDEAKQAVLDDKRSFESEFALLHHFAESQQWERADEHFQHLCEFADEFEGFRWLELRYDAMKRRNEEAKGEILAAAEDLAELGGDGEFSLAVHLRNEANRVMAAPEQHRLLEILKPLYYRQPEHTLAAKEWDQAWMWSLQNVGRRADALAAAKANAEKYSWDSGAQTQYVNMLSNQGDRPAALKWLEAKIAEKHWSEAERNQFRASYLNNLDAENRTPEVKAFLEVWMKQQPDSIYAWTYQRYAAALVQLDEVERAHKLVEKWLKAAVKGDSDKLAAGERLRLEGALNFLFNGAYGIYRQTIEERFHEPLAAVVRKFALHKDHHNFAARIMGDHRFYQTDQIRELRAEFTELLQKRSGELPYAEVARLVGWIMPNQPAVEVATWREIVGPMIARWSKLDEAGERDTWASVISNILSSRVGNEAYTDFLRRQLRESPKGHEGRYAQILFNHLTSGVWSEPVEAEAFDLLYVIAPHGGVSELEREGRDLAFRAGALLHLNNWVQRNGYAALYGAVEKKEDLSRTELAAIQREKREEIRTHLSEKLAEELEERDGLDEGFAHWLNIERLYFDIALKRDPAEIAAECWEFLGKYDPLVEDDKRTWNQALLIGRYLDTLEYLAAKPKARAALVGSVLALHQKGIAGEEESDAWKRRHYRMLVALDRPAALKKALASWIRPEEADTHWRVTLGYLLAELNDLDGAIAEFEAVEKADELRPREYKTLADWYLVRDKKAERERALLGYYDTMPDHQISNLIYQRTSQIRQGFENGAPEDLDPEVASMFVALLRKTPQPQSYVHQLGELYRYTKDFRMLECVPEGIIGHSAVQVYPYLQTMASVHQHIRDEATSDMIFEHLEKVRTRVETKIDARGLDLLEMLVRRKASEVLNQPGQHLPQALAAMKRAFAREWDPGERKLMANFLYHLGRITQQTLADEQLREFAILHRDEKTDSDRTEIGHLYGQLLWQYGRHDEALQVLETVLRDAEDYAGGSLPQAAQNVLSTFISYLSTRKHYARAENEIFRVLGQDIVSDMRRWLRNRKYQLYNEALGGDGEVSIGKGLTLYQNATRQLIAELPEVDHVLRYQLVNTLANTYRTAHGKKIGDAPGDARDFAYGAFDELVPFATSNYQNLVTTVANTLRHLISYREGLAFLITRYEKEPKSFRAQQNGAWRRYGSTIADYRYHAHAKGGIGNLEPRLLKIVLAELRRDLETRQQLYNGIYWGPNHSYFWKEKKDDFARVAEEVLKERSESDQTVVYIARYLHDGLRLHERAIDILIAMYKQERLDENAWSLMISYLERAHRWPEAIEYMVPLVAFRPDNLQYRIRLIASYHHNGQKKEQIATLDAIDKRWHEKGWWNEGTLQQVASICHATKLWRRAVEYYDELIPLHQRNHPRRGIGNGTLSSYFTTLADCHANLGDTPAAVEAASGAIVSWGRHIQNRSNALHTLVSVLRKSQDLPGYIEFLDKEVAETGLENPIVRKALGQVFFEKNEHDQAIRHLTLAVETQPDDEKTHRLLIDAYQKKGDTAGVIARILEAAKLNRRNIAFFKDLAEQYEKVERPAEAERARTNIVEALPNESEGHAMLAEIRQKQDRWEDAAAHWGQVAIIRELEPTGLQKLADAQIKLGRDAAATESLKKLLAKDWPSRFGNVHRDARNKLAQLEKKAG